MVRGSKNKKRDRKRKNQQKNPPPSCSSSNGNPSSNTGNKIQNKVNNAAANMLYLSNYIIFYIEMLGILAGFYIQEHKEIYNNISQVLNGSHGTRDSVMDHDDFLSAFCETLRSHSIGDDKLTLEEEFDDCDVDDELDPALKEKLDRLA